MNNFNLGQLLVWSYAYYYLDRSLVSDEMFDGCMQYCIDNYDKIEHMHKHLIDPKFKASLFYIKEKHYPNIVKEIAKQKPAI